MSSIPTKDCEICDFFDQYVSSKNMLDGAKPSTIGPIVGVCTHPSHSTGLPFIPSTGGCGDFALAPPASPSLEIASTRQARGRRQLFVLQKIQPMLLGLTDGSVSTLAPIFATVGITGRPLTAFFVGLAASVGAAVSMGLAEALSDDGKLSGRGSPITRGTITGAATAVGGMLHALPFLLPDLKTALHLAYTVVFFELLAIAYVRYHFMNSPLVRTIIQVVIGGGIVFLVGVSLGKLGGG